jgi:hypothetical protein
MRRRRLRRLRRWCGGGGGGGGAAKVAERRKRRAPIHLHVIVHPNGQIDHMPVSLKDTVSAKILCTLDKKFGCSSHAVVLDGDLCRTPYFLTMLPQGHKPRNAIDVDASDAAPALHPPLLITRLSQISGLDP